MHIPEEGYRARARPGLSDGEIGSDSIDMPPSSPSTASIGGSGESQRRVR
jgi:hypothetical protein